VAVAKKAVVKKKAAAKKPAVKKTAVEHVGKGRPCAYKEKYCKMLIKHMESGFSFQSFAGVVGVCKQTLYNWRDEKPAFLDAKKTGDMRTLLFWEGLGIKGASGNIKNFNATSFIYNMKNRFGGNWTRDDYEQSWSDKQEIEHSGGVGINVLKDEEGI
jgi:hypothetical protein